MEFRLSSEQEMFQKSVRAFAQKVIEPQARAIDEQANGIPDDIVSGLAGLGVFGLMIPESYGGMAVAGEEVMYGVLAVSELARADLGMAVPVYALLCLGWSYMVSLRGSETLKRELLPKVASGELFLGICSTEPGGGSDVAGFRTSATRQGDRYIVNGDKVFISGVSEARQRGGGHLTLVRTTPGVGNKGMTLMYIPSSLPGITPTSFPDMGRNGLSTGGMAYQDVEVPAEYVIGAEGSGFYMLMEGFNIARTLVAAACMGAAERALEMSAAFARERVLFGAPLIKNQGISFEIAEDRARLVMLRTTLMRAAWMLDQHYKDRSFSTKELNEIVSICKLTAPPLALDVIRHAMIHHGAFGYTKECPLEMAMRGVMSYNVGAEGGLNIMKIIIAREFVGDVAVSYRS
jgi:acyl-CoA dehydrogenase